MFENVISQAIVSLAIGFVPVLVAMEIGWKMGKRKVDENGIEMKVLSRTRRYK